MWVKICGNTRLQDCLLAAELGADAVGFIFAEGKRTVTAQQVAAITSQLPAPLEKIGVFTATDADTIAAMALAAGLTGVQLHSSYDPLLASAVRAGVPAAKSIRLLQVVQWNMDARAEDQLAAFSAEVERIAADGVADVLLVDSRTANINGGTGRTFDWTAAAPALADAGLPVIVAGGLNQENVAGAIGMLLPWGVDVSSGVEDAPGAKNAGALRRFVETAKASY